MARKGRILVVDDNRLVLATLTEGLTRAGYDVIDADNGDDAILLAREHRPELALLDIRMEGKSGFDVAHYLRSQHATPFMFLSAFSDDETVAQVKALGAVAYLVKPLDIKQIVPVVDAAFADIDAGVHAGPAELAPAATTSAATPTRTAATAAATAGGEGAVEAPVETVVAMAAGVLMHRHSLARGPALARLRSLAAAERRSVAAQAEALLAAVEQLAAS